jgi:hypothetical protein
MLVTLTAQVSTAASEHKLTKKELKELIANAKTPEDHQKVAAYYRAEAKRLRASAQEHKEWAETYAKSPVYTTRESKTGDTLMGPSHCKKWAELESEEADEADALAASHEDMAKAAAH